MCPTNPYSVWGPAEAKKAATGHLPEAVDLDHDLYLAWIRDCDARKCHSLALTEPSIDPLLRARALLFRGELEDARTAIDSLQTNTGTTAELKSDALLEAARLAAYEGDWALSRELSTRAMESGTLEPLSFLSCLQVRALAHFEQGELLDAKADLVSAESLGSVFPHSISWLYARVLAARIAARDEGLSTGLGQLDRLWQSLLETETMTAEQAHALVFGEIDIWRWEALRSGERGPLERLVLASWAMTEATGERLYAGLACLDAAIFGPLELRDLFRRKAEGLSEFARIRRACAEIFGDSHPTSGTASLQRSLRADSPATAAAIRRPADAPVIKYVVDARRKLTFQVSPWRIANLAGQERVLGALRAVARGPITKASFFSSTWGIAKYSSILHDSSISNLLNRVRKLAEIPVRVRSGIVESPKELLVL